MKKLAALLILAAACGPGLVEFPSVTQGTGPGGGGPPGSPAVCAATPGLVYCGAATCDTLGVLHCGLNNGVCESCPGGYSCSSGKCAPPSTCSKGLVLCSDSCCSATQVAAGGNTTCAIVGQGASTGVYCWGANDSGQAGPAAAGATTALASELATLRGASAIAVGTAHGCAIVGTSVLCWGRNDAHQLGSGATVSQSADPIVVPEAAGATAIAAGERHSCAITPQGAVCWGANEVGQRGDTSPIALAQGATKIVAGANHTCAMRSTSVVCWGADDVGQMGTGSRQASAPPTTLLFSNITGIADIAAGFHHNCAIVTGPFVDRTNALRCWGGNESAQIDATRADKLSPANVQAFGSSSPSEHVAAGRAHTCVIRNQTDTACFGDNSSLQLNFPVVGPTVIAAGGDHSCMIDTSSQIHCFGSNASSELGPFGP